MRGFRSRFLLAKAADEKTVKAVVVVAGDYGFSRAPFEPTTLKSRVSSREGIRTKMTNEKKKQKNNKNNDDDIDLDLLSKGGAGAVGL